MTKRSLPTVSVRASVPAQNNGATFRGFLPSVGMTLHIVGTEVDRAAASHSRQVSEVIF
jgi:hypothetical protein